MNRDDIVQKLQDMREHYHAAMNEAIAEHSESAASELIAGDEILLPLIEAVKQGKSIAGSVIVGDTIGERVKYLRALNNMSQHALLALLGRPKSHQSWLARVESDQARFDAADLKSIAKIFGVTIDDLIP